MCEKTSKVGETVDRRFGGPLIAAMAIGTMVLTACHRAGDLSAPPNQQVADDSQPDEEPPSREPDIQEVALEKLLAQARESKARSREKARGPEAGEIELAIDPKFGRPTIITPRGITVDEYDEFGAEPPRESALSEADEPGLDALLPAAVRAAIGVTDAEARSFFRMLMEADLRRKEFDRLREAGSLTGIEHQAKLEQLAQELEERADRELGHEKSKAIAEAIGQKVFGQSFSDEGVSGEVDEPPSDP